MISSINYIVLVLIISAGTLAFVVLYNLTNINISERIKEIARDNQIEIVENKPLARMLYHNVDIGAEIPPELYQMVAEVLAYVYGLKGKL